MNSNRSVGSSEVDDRTLAKQAGQGNSSSFEELYRRHYNMVYLLCLKMCNETEAADLTQISLIHVYQKINMFRGEVTFTTWLQRIVTNKALGYFRERKRQQPRSTDYSELLEHLPANPASWKDEEKRALNSLIIQQALERLPTGCRKVFILRTMEGYSHREIAARLGCSESNSKVQLWRALAKLRKLIDKKVDTLKKGT